MRRAFLDHWKGVAAGLVVFNVGLALLVLMLLVSGATAARIGAQVVAWRGALTGVLGMVEASVIGGFYDEPSVALGCIVLGSVTYAGGGLAKLLTWARRRPA